METASRHCSTGGTILLKGKTTMDMKRPTDRLQDLKCQGQHPGNKQTNIRLTSQRWPPLIPLTATRLHFLWWAAFWGLKGFWRKAHQILLMWKQCLMMIRTIKLNVRLPPDLITSFLHLTHPTSFQLVLLITWVWEDLMNEQSRTGRGDAAVFLRLKLKSCFHPQFKRHYHIYVLNIPLLRLSGTSTSAEWVCF